MRPASGVSSSSLTLSSPSLSLSGSSFFSSLLCSQPGDLPRERMRLASGVTVGPRGPDPSRRCHPSRGGRTEDGLLGLPRGALEVGVLVAEHEASPTWRLLVLLLCSFLRLSVRFLCYYFLDYSYRVLLPEMLVFFSVFRTRLLYVAEDHDNAINLVFWILMNILKDSLRELKNHHGFLGEMQINFAGRVRQCWVSLGLFNLQFIFKDGNRATHFFQQVRVLFSASSVYEYFD
jgi:hypothetical protein